jgi:hypothetical protein
MLDNLNKYAYATVTGFIFATLGYVLGYIFDRTYNKTEPEVSEYYYTPNELPNTQDIPSSDDAVPTVASEQYCLDPSEQCCMATPEVSEPNVIPTPITEPIVSSEYKRPPFDYRHEFWPSPRPVNFVKALVKSDHVQIEGRLSHGKAIELLASRAEMKPDEFLRVDPITYTKFFMPAQYNAAMLLGQSIQRLEDTIRRHQYLNTLRRHG